MAVIPALETGQPMRISISSKSQGMEMGERGAGGCRSEEEGDVQEPEEDVRTAWAFLQGGTPLQMARKVMTMGGRQTFRNVTYSCQMTPDAMS